MMVKHLIEFFFFALFFLRRGSEKWSVPCHISKQGSHRHQGFPPSKCEFLSPEGTCKEQCLQSSGHQVAATR